MDARKSHGPFGEGLNYLFVCSKLNVATNWVKSSCTADINMSLVVRLKDSDKVGTFCLLWKEAQTISTIINIQRAVQYATYNAKGRYKEPWAIAFIL